jgi:aryl-alcohol dehydrogenase-like predicted oxidoreductase
MIATKPPLGRPEYLRQQAEMSLRRLGLDHIDLFQLHRIGFIPWAPVAVGGLERGSRRPDCPHR